MSFDDVFTFYEVQTKSKIFHDHTIGKSTKKMSPEVLSNIFEPVQNSLKWQVKQLSWKCASLTTQRSQVRFLALVPNGVLILHATWRSMSGPRGDPNRTRIQNQPDPDQTRPDPVHSLTVNWVPHADIIWRLTNGRLPRGGGAVD